MKNIETHLLYVLCTVMNIYFVFFFPFPYCLFALTNNKKDKRVQ